MKAYKLTTFAAAAALVAACAEGEPPVDYETPVDSIEPTEETTAEQPMMEEGVTLGTATLADGGMYLTDGAGRAVYMFTADEQGSGESACYDACAEMWPPVLAEEGVPSTGTGGLDASMLDTIERRDGSRQITFNGWPLYHYAQDTGPGMTQGQDVHESGGEWYLVTPEGEKLESSGS